MVTLAADPNSRINFEASENRYYIDLVMAAGKMVRVYAKHCIYCGGVDARTEGEKSLAESEALDQADVCDCLPLYEDGTLEESLPVKYDTLQKKYYFVHAPADQEPVSIYLERCPWCGLVPQQSKLCL
jgi:hypothetical protein